MDFSEVTIEELVNGFSYGKGNYSCLFCSIDLDEDEVFPIEGKFLMAKGMMKQHVKTAHNSAFQSLLSLDKKVTGLSDVQIEMLQHFYDGNTDQDIVETSSVNSVSTVRQHRFKLREKERQAKVFLALMQLMKDPQKYTIHKGAKQVDERYGIEQAEREKVLQTYFKNGLDGGIETIPSKEKKKLIILQHILNRFERGKTYSEKEVNELLKTVHADFVSLRRHLIEYGFMVRNGDGSVYSVKE